MPKGGGNQSRTHPVDRARGQTALVSVTPATPGERCAGPMVVMVETQASGQSPAIPLQETPSDTPGLDATVILGANLLGRFLFSNYIPSEVNTISNT